MSFNTALLDFSVDPVVVTNPVECATLHQRMEEVVGAAVPGLTRLIEDLTPTGGFLMNYSAANETFVTLRGHRSGLISLQIENYGDSFIMENRELLALENDIREKIGARRGKVILPLHRGRDIDSYFYTSDERLLEYGILETIFDEVTPYQHVQVVRTRDFGKILMLDGFYNHCGRRIQVPEGGAHLRLHLLRPERQSRLPEARPRRVENGGRCAAGQHGVAEQRKKYMTHVIGINSPAVIQEFENMVDALPHKTTRTQSTAYVPSFMETWVFYQITKC